MALYFVQVPEAGKITLENGNNALVVSAEDTAEAKLAAKAYMQWPSDAAWAAATVTALEDVTDTAGWRLRVEIDTAAGARLHDLTITAVTVGDFDSMGNLMAAAGVAAGLTSTYSTPDLEMATIGDGIGDHTMRVTLLPPITWDDPTIPFSSMTGTITHEGIAGAILNVVLLDVIAPSVPYQVQN